MPKENGMWELYGAEGLPEEVRKNFKVRREVLALGFGRGRYEDDGVGEPEEKDGKDVPEEDGVPDGMAR